MRLAGSKVEPRDGGNVAVFAVGFAAVEWVLTVDQDVLAVRILRCLRQRYAEIAEKIVIRVVIPVR